LPPRPRRCGPPSTCIASSGRAIKASGFHLSLGDWIRLLRQSGFVIEDLVEVRPRRDASTRFPFVTLEWSRQWPCEQVWKVRKAG